MKMGKKREESPVVKSVETPTFDTREQASSYRRDHGGRIVEEDGRFKVVRPE